MRRILLGLGLVCALGAAAAAAPKDKPAYPEGFSIQFHDGNRFELLLPALEDGQEYGLVVYVTEYGGGAKDLQALTTGGYVVCAPRFKAGVQKRGWATSEAKDIVAVATHVSKKLPVGKDRVHLIVNDDLAGFWSFVAFAKKSPFVSAALVKARYTGGSVPKSAKKRMNVLAFDWEPAGGIEGTDRIEEKLAGKVRTVELREDEDALEGAYFRYWLDVMDGRFEPGRDRSFEWNADPEPGLPFETAKADAIRSKLPAFLYFYDEADATNPDAKRLQNEVFFDPAVREAGRHLVPVTLNRTHHGKLFGDLGLTRTPAIVVTDHRFEPVARFEGAVKAAALAKALRQAHEKAAKSK